MTHEVNCKYSKYYNDGQMHSMNEEGYRCNNEKVMKIRHIDCPFYHDDIAKLLCKEYNLS